jgi:hypothetical protein
VTTANRALLAASGSAHGTRLLRNRDRHLASLWPCRRDVVYGHRIDNVTPVIVTPIIVTPIINGQDGGSMEIGYTLMTEQAGLTDLVRYAVAAEQAGFAFEVLQ